LRERHRFGEAALIVGALAPVFDWFDANLRCGKRGGAQLRVITHAIELYRRCPADRPLQIERGEWRSLRRQRLNVTNCAVRDRSEHEQHACPDQHSPHSRIHASLACDGTAPAQALTRSSAAHVVATEIEM
jgi:hypothetical protein